MLLYSLIYKEVMCISKQYIKIAKKETQKPTQKRQELKLSSTNSIPNIQDIKQLIDLSFRNQEPHELIYAHIETLPTPKHKAQVCRELSQRYWALNTKTSKNLSVKFDKFAKQFEQPQQTE